MTELRVEQKILARNDALAKANHELFASAGVRRSVNLISSPGSGKTTLLETTLRRLPGGVRAAVIEGDVQTENDAERIARTGVPVEAVVTGGACHLDAAMVRRAFDRLRHRSPGGVDLLIIENVGNLVCPATYDLGEDEKVALVSVTEGEDKPLKYPAVFHHATAAVVTKADLLPHLDVDLDLLLRNLRAVNPELRVFVVSARTGEGMEAWIRFLLGESG
ncbi:hydrogenase nickel incorporation protein HypB [Deferrisoma palaeochoriense]